MSYELFWGDLHSHCSVSYGHGTVKQALLRAQRQLDFCSITGHAFWPDMPADRSRYGEIIDYHQQGFSRLAENWDELLQSQQLASLDGKFLCFPSYEWHSLEYGDHNVYDNSATLRLQDAETVQQLRGALATSGSLAIPHHIGYAAGYRGINWDHFSEQGSPFVEVFSLHGCSLDSKSPYPMLHDMGPRDEGSTAVAGWDRGFQFGIVGGTDHHGAYPGSWGDGRMGVFAERLDRDALWDAFQQRRVYAATGDRIDARLFIDGAWIGSAIKAPNARRVDVRVQAPDRINSVDLVKNEVLLRRFTPKRASSSETSKWRLRVTWGWGPRQDVVAWQGELNLSSGTINESHSCFRGDAVVSPKQGSSSAQVPDDTDLPHSFEQTSPRSCVWKSLTQGNLTMRHAATQSISLGVDADLDCELTISVNGTTYGHRLADLLNATRSHYLRGWLSEAIQIGPLVPLNDCTVEASLEDAPERDIDRYRLVVTQENGQCAWLSPIWVER